MVFLFFQKMLLMFGATTLNDSTIFMVFFSRPLTNHLVRIVSKVERVAECLYLTLLSLFLCCCLLGKITPPYGETLRGDPGRIAVTCCALLPVGSASPGVTITCKL